MTNYDLLKQMEKFGACSATGGASARSVDDALNGSQRKDLSSAVAKVRDGGSLNNAEIGQFKDFYGISPAEFTTLFCKSNTSGDFVNKVEDLTISNSSSPTGMVSFLLDVDVDGDGIGGVDLDKDKDIDSPSIAVVRSAISRAPEELKSRIEGYYTKLDAAETASEAVTLATEQCNKGVALQCSSRQGKQANLNKLRTELSEVKRVLVNDLTSVPRNTSIPSNLEISDRDSRAAEKLRSALGNAFPSVQSAYADFSREQSTSTGGLSAAGIAERERLKACVDKSFKVVGTNDRVSTATATSNFKGCNTRRLNSLTTSQLTMMSGSYYLKAKDGNRGCYVAEEASFSKPSCTPSGAAIRVSTGAAIADGDRANRQEVCLEDVIAKYSAYEIFCGSAPTSSAGSPCKVLVGGESVDGTTERTSSGDYRCVPADEVAR